MANTNNATSITIGGKFKLQGNESQSNWSFEYSQLTKKVSLNVYLNDSNLTSTNAKNNQLSSDLSKDDITHIISWLNSVQTSLPE